MKRIFYFFCIYLPLFISLVSCDKFLEAYSPNLITVRSISDLDEVLIGSVYVPSARMTYVTQNPVANWLNYLDDDVNTVIGASSNIHPLGPAVTSAQMGYMYGYTTWQLDVAKNYEQTATGSEYGTWKYLYQRINIVNVVLDEIEQVEKLKETEQLDYFRIKGEAHFLRAQFYFMLVNLYAKPYVPNAADSTLGIPLKLTHYVEHKPHQDEQFKRTPVKVVYNQLVSDLEASIQFFKQGSKRETTLRANEDAAKVLLSRVYLYMEEYEKAKTYANEIVSQNQVLESMAPDNKEYFFLNRENSEVLFSQGSLGFQTTFIGAPRDFCVSADLVSSFQKEDKRLTTYFKKTQYSDSTALGRKYINGMHQSYVSDQFMIRSAEAYLNLAEACAMLGEDSEANRVLNLLKSNRIDGYAEMQLSGRQLVDEVRAERRRELCFEGHRWFDLRRYAVNTKYPFSKPIVRVFAVYTGNGTFVQAEEYLLKENDPAYVFQIPAEVREFQPAMPLNERVVRKPSKIINIKF